MARLLLSAAALLVFETALVVSASFQTVQNEPASNAETVVLKPNSGTTALRAAARFLWSKQADDGGWHSETYGLLKSGQALTPLVLHALLEVPEAVCERPPGRVEAALAFLRRHADPRGAIGVADPDVLGYPNYSTALALRCLLIAGAADDRDLIQRMRSHLEREQFTEARGFDPSMLAYGGWGFGGEQPSGKTGHTDLSHVRFVLEALRHAGAERRVFERSQAFLRVVQKDPRDGRPQPSFWPEEEEEPEPTETFYDGGFYISPIMLAANKGQPTQVTHPRHWRSYATATCDGVLALLAADVSIDDQRMRDARAWLRRRPRLDYPEGIPIVSDDYPLPWGEAIRFYHYAVRAEAYAALDWPGDWRDALAAELADLQRDDGSFINQASPLMKENDPLVATALVVRALILAR